MKDTHDGRDPFEILAAANPVDEADVHDAVLTPRAADALETILGAERRPANLRRALGHSRKRRKLTLAIATLVALVIGGAAIAAGIFKSTDAEQAGMIAGYRLFAGSDPRCESLSANSYRCTLDRPPHGELFYDQNGTRLENVFLGVVAETTDEKHRVDGACVGASADGRVWDCYLGEAAVDHGLIAESYLGTYRAQPATG